MQKNHFFLGGFRKKCHICIRNPKGGIAQLARAPALQAGGRRFDSDYLHKKDLLNRSGLFRFIPVSLSRHILAQRKIPVVLHFLHHRHKAGGASPLA